MWVWNMRILADAGDLSHWLGFLGKHMLDGTRNLAMRLPPSLRALNHHLQALAEGMARYSISRDALFITTKIAPSESSPEDAKASLSQSLKDLGLAYVDLLLVHWPTRYVRAPTANPVPFPERLGYTPEALLETWRALEEAVDDGLVRSIGVSNCSVSKVEALQKSARIPISCNQMELHPYLPQQDLVDWHAKQGIVLTGYSPLGSPGRPAVYRHEDDLPDLISAPILQEIATERGVTTAHVMLQWAVARGTIPIWRSVTATRIAENVAAIKTAGGKGGAAGLCLTEGDFSKIASLSSGSGFRWNKGEHMATLGQTWESIWL
jgi:alcohol dehydrogenase (NADP+)